MSLMSQFYAHPQKIQMSVFTASGSYSPAVDSWHWFVVVGGGGGGAVALESGGGNWVAATGGNGGSVRYGWVFLSAAQTYTITTGAGGGAVTGVASTATAGNAGTQSKLSGGDLAADIIAKGGTAGSAHIASAADYSVTAHTMENAANASGSGAGVDATGGKGGTIVLNSSMNGGAEAFAVGSGGGAANIRGVSAAGISGGDITITTNVGSSEAVWAGTGGGGTGGSGGDISDLSDESTGTSGGGTAGNGSQEVVSVDPTLGGIGTGETEYLTPGGIGGEAWNDPTSANFDLGSQTGGKGGGGGVLFPDSGGSYAIGVGKMGDGGIFAGGAGAGHQDSNGAGDGGGAGGGGGGGASTSSGTGIASGAGGDGVIVLQGFFSPSN